MVLDRLGKLTTESDYAAGQADRPDAGTYSDASRSRTAP